MIVSTNAIGATLGFLAQFMPTLVRGNRVSTNDRPMKQIAYTHTAGPSPFQPMGKTAQNRAVAAPRKTRTWRIGGNE